MELDVCALFPRITLAARGSSSASFSSTTTWGNITYREGWGGENASFTATYTNNKRNGLSYDAAGNLTNDGGQSYSYDATGQQATASYSGYLLQQHYDGDGLRVKKSESGVVTYYLRSSVLGGQVVAELTSSGTWQRGYVYLGGQLLAVQQANAVSWLHQDPVAKSKRVTNSAGTVVSIVELDPWGGNTNRSNNDAFQPRKFTTYERDGNASDEAMFRRYNRWWSRFDQPDPYEGSYDLTNPQSFNRYAYVQNDPVNFVDPTGLFGCQSVPIIDGEGRIARDRHGFVMFETVCTMSLPDGPERLPDDGGGGGDPGPVDPEPQNPIQAANQDPNCLTINKLLANSRITRAFDAAWQATKKSGKENGGWVFSDENYPTDVFVHQAPEGTEGYMKGEPEAFKELLKTLPTSRPRRFILDYHTHKFSPLPGSDI